MQNPDILTAIANGDFHRPGALRCAQLFSLEPTFFERLRSDVARLVVDNLPSEVADEHHVTNWTKPYGRAIQFSLLNGSGDLSDTSVDHDRSVYGKRFHHAATYPALGELIGLFPHAVNMRLNGMSPSGGLSPHEEHLAWRKGRRYYFRARFHLPIETNPGAEVLLDGDLLHLEAGNIYFFNNGCIHAASNTGDTQRFHLVWDMLLSDETLELMFGEGSHGPLLRTPPEQRAVPVRRSVGVDAYQISGPGAILYQALHLGALGITPHAWQNRFNDARYAFFKAVGRPTPAPVQ